MGLVLKKKKGFIIDGTIVLNHDRFDSTTVFHEFGHYYARWFEYNQEHMLLLWRMYRIHTRVIYLVQRYVQYHRLKAFRN
jgi:hypothetical protein